MMSTAAVSRQKVYNSEVTQNDSIEIGPGNLKLIYSGKEGKLTQYINGRNSVCEIGSIFMHISKEHIN